MTMTPTKQTPSECRWNHDCIFCLHPNTIKHDNYCDDVCPDYQPKEKKDNDSRTTENN